MSNKKLLSIHPVIPIRDMQAAISYYVGKLGFAIVFDDADGDAANASYAGIARDGLCLHFQLVAPEENPTMPQIGIHDDGVDNLHAEYQDKGIVALSGKLRNTDWGTREFGVYALNKTALVFYEQSGK